MDKVFPIIISVLAIGIVIYTLPDFLNFFGFNYSSASVKPVIYIYNGKDFSPSYFEGVSLPSVYDITPDKLNGLLYAGTSNGLFISKDGGKKWYSFSDLEKILTKAKVYQIKFSPLNNHKIYISLFKNGKGGIYESSNNFFTLNKIFDLGKEMAYKIEPYGNSFLLGISDGRLLRYDLREKTFSFLYSFHSAIKDIAVSGNNIYVATKENNLWKKEGDIFKEVPNIEIVDLTSRYKNIYAASLYDLYRTFHNQWRKIPSIAKTNSHIFSTSYGLYLSSKNKLYKSFDLDKKWQVVGSLKRKITALAYFKNNLIIGTGNDL